MLNNRCRISWHPSSKNAEILRRLAPTCKLHICTSQICSLQRVRLQKCGRSIKTFLQTCKQQTCKLQTCKPPQVATQHHLYPPDLQRQPRSKQTNLRSPQSIRRGQNTMLAARAEQKSA